MTQDIAVLPVFAGLKPVIHFVGYNIAATEYLHVKGV
jgi:hypothetical protein